MRTSGRKPRKKARAICSIISFVFSHSFALHLMSNRRKHKLPASEGVQTENADTLGLWRNNAALSHLLQRLALKYLCILATSASSQIFFSARWGAVKLLRSRLANGYLGNLNMLNSKKLVLCVFVVAVNDKLSSRWCCCNATSQKNQYWVRNFGFELPFLK